jgi:glycerol-3-phosphate acyltransferase PlsX
MHGIALDAMGGDGAPRVIVEGALSAIREWPDRFDLMLVGDPARIEPLLGDEVPESLRLVTASQVIEGHESPVRAVRRKPHSSIVVGLELLRDGGADAFISAGSTGAVMAASRLLLGLVPGVERPTVGTMFPTAGSPVCVVDSGANIDTRPWHLLQFAHLGAVYVRDLLEIEDPRVGLLNVGVESSKGDARTLATYRLLEEDEDLHFVGNVEGDGIISGACDVLVCDGFVGNVLLKFYESVASFMSGVLSRHLDAAAGGEVLRDVYRKLDYAEYGGAPLLGVDGVSIICHGGSSGLAIKNAIGVAGACLDSGMVADLASELDPLTRRAKVWRRIRRR